VMLISPLCRCRLVSDGNAKLCRLMLPSGEQ
jgi:hypothetical protein